MTCFSEVSDSVKSGAFCPTCGAPRDGGNCFARMKNDHRNNPIAATLRVVSTQAITLAIFERPRWNARLRPITSRTIANATRSRLGQGKSRVDGYRTKNNGKLSNPPNVRRNPAQICQLNLFIFVTISAAASVAAVDLHAETTHPKQGFLLLSGSRQVHRFASG